jgi:hypothetical protein
MSSRTTIRQIRAALSRPLASPSQAKVYALIFNGILTNCPAIARSR